MTIIQSRLNEPSNADPSNAWFAWKHYHPHESEDPSAVWAAAWKAGGRAALQSSSRISGLLALLYDLTWLLEDGHVEAELRRQASEEPAF